jgi:hypothetical protein
MDVLAPPERGPGKGARGAVSASEDRARRDAHTAWTYAVNCVIREDQPLQPRGSVVDSYAIDLLDQLSGDYERLLAAARAACIVAADEVGSPGRWRPAIRAVELCQRAAELIEVKEAGQ